MDLRVSGTEVFLQLDSGYVAEDDAALLTEVGKFKPLVDWLTKFRPSDFSLSVITIRSVSKVAQRLSSIVFEVTLVSKSTKEVLTQGVTLTDEPGRVIVLPIVVVEGKKYGVLVSNHRVALGGSMQEEAFLGFFQKDGNFDCLAADALLTPLGISTNEKYCQPLSEEEISLGDDGFPPVRPVFIEQAFSPAEFESHFGAQKNVVNGQSLSAHAVEELAPKTNDIHALLAVSLYNAKAAAPAN